ncbi:NACHT and WD repeat domain-containing 2-like [Brachionus plicatilis]|uniref:NACHT and WD repeat domain-containing 2-like n=1 Tax=Brachionus plicatilis TaxID=10195 RepID=A0A3M7RVD1_BRAPC|nr:NACHT and WD repeat domain-containing 2-like [Brachionus plicatilis]
MGCACSRAHLSEDKRESRTKNLTNETDLGGGSCVNKYVKITDCNDTETNLSNQVDRSEISKSSKSKGKKQNLKSDLSYQETNVKVFNKQNSNNSLLKPITNLFSKFSSSNTLIDSQLVNINETQFSESVNLVEESLNQQNKILNESNGNSSNQLKPNTNQSCLSVYSIHNLPIRTQYLLNSHEDIEKLNVLDLSRYFDSHGMPKKLNSEIQLYLSLPYYLTDLALIDANLMKSNMLLLDKHLNEEFQNVDKSSDLSAMCLFDFLRLYCAQHTTNTCDLNVINLNNYRSKSTQINLLSNKYFRRALGVIILNDLLSVKQANKHSYNSYNKFLPGYNTFVIYLSEGQIEEENWDELLCPDTIDESDYKNLLERKLLMSNLTDLFHKYYKLDKTMQSYRLEIYFFESEVFDKDMKVLYEFFRKAENESVEPGNEMSFGLKYLKSIQQQEIEIIVSHAEPQSIIWVHMTKVDFAFNRTCSNEFNGLRYTKMLRLLQSKVLTNKYKHFAGESLNSSSHGSPQTILNDFIYNSVKSLIDKLTFELNKNQNEIIALKIDKQLANEIFKHYNYFNYLKRSFFGNSYSFKLESMLNDYVNDTTLAYSHPLVVFNESKISCQDSCHNETITYFDILMSKWLNKLIDTRSKKNDSNRKSSIIYRYCNHSILSSDLTTLLQSVFHQLCYIIEIHESCAFDCPKSLVDNISIGLNKYFSKSENEHKEIVIILNNLNSLIKSDHECQLIEAFIENLYSQMSQSRLKLVITLSNVDPCKTLLEKLSKIFTDSAKKVTNSIEFDFVDQKSKTQFEKLELISKKSNLEPIFSLIKYLLRNSRYGVKQSECIELILNSDSSSHLNKFEISHQFSLIWYAIKYFTNSVSILNENNQILYKLRSDNSSISPDYKDFIYMFYNRSDPNLSQRTNLVTNFKSRVFHELPSSFYLSNQDNGEFKEFYLREFILNPKWILNKSFLCSSILYILHDINFYKSIEPSQNEHLNKFEKFLYQDLYNLNQDQNQLYLMAKLDARLENMFTTMEFINKSANLSSLPQFFMLGGQLLDKKNLINLNQLSKELNYFSKVVFLDKGCFLTLSEQPYNEIKIWKVSLNGFMRHELELIRTIKFNKTPKDVRLINKHIAVVLVERNLHLINLNKGSHLLDLNSTMNPNLALFELHDSNHIVLLARNRLSVILMKLPPIEMEADIDDKKVPLINSNSENMFLFKVGEDRYLNSLLVSKNGKIMVCGDEVQKPFPLLVWNLNQRKLIYDLRQQKHEFITSISCISSSGKYVVSACQEEGESKNCLIVYDLTTGQLFKKLKAKENFVCVEISEETGVIIACLENSQIYVYNLEDGSKKFAINSNRFPVNRIKLLDSNKLFKNHFLTYDTHGYDLTVRLWDLSRGDQLISSITCPSRIVSLETNASMYYFEDSEDCSIFDHILITACLFGMSNFFIFKLDYYTNIKKETKVEFGNYSDDAALNGLVKDIKV